MKTAQRPDDYRHHDTQQTTRVIANGNEQVWIGQPLQPRKPANGNAITWTDSANHQDPNLDENPDEQDDTIREPVFIAAHHGTLTTHRSEAAATTRLDFTANAATASATTRLDVTASAATAAATTRLDFTANAATASATASAATPATASAAAPATAPAAAPATASAAAPATASAAAPAVQVKKVALPPQKGLLRRLASHPKFMHYNRLIAAVFVANIAYLLSGTPYGLTLSQIAPDLALVSNLALVNLSLAILIRQQYVVNALFKIATSAPTSWPLPIRWILGKVYHFGGLHVGGAIAGTIWFAVLMGAQTYHFARGTAPVSLATILTAHALLATLIVILVMSMPKIRERFHDHFERTHRFGGWTALLLFWGHTILSVNDLRGDLGLGSALVASPGLWMLILLTFSIALPWMRLRKVPVDIVRPSNHVALARFDYGVKPFAGSSTTLSRHPLLEWHAFANVPAPDEDGYRLTISRAGDWTGGFIDDKPSHVWVKGIPTAGVGNIDKLFKRVVWIATGSGIGPCVPHLLAQEVPAHLVWSTRSPRATYGDELVDEILAVQPDALIWDTDDRGRPNLVELAYQAYKHFDAEAVICISNKKLTWQVVHGLESRGIPAYGAIWDS